MSGQKRSISDYLPKGFTVGSVRFGPGVVGRTTTAMVVVALVFGVIAYKTSSDDALLTVAVILAVLFVLFVIAAYGFGLKNPDAAVMEGTQLSDVRKLAMTLGGQAMKEVPNVPATSIIDVAPEKVALPESQPDKAGG